MGHEELFQIFNGQLEKLCKASVNIEQGQEGNVNIKTQSGILPYNYNIWIFY